MTAMSHEELRRLRRSWWRQFILGTSMCYLGLGVAPFIRWTQGEPVKVWYYACTGLLFTVLQYGVGQWAWNHRVRAKK